MPQSDFFVRRLYFPENIPRPPPMPYEGNRSTTKRGKERNAMNEDYIHYDEADEAEDLALKNPLYGWTEEEIKEFLRELYGLDEFYEEDYKRIGRF